MSQFPFLPFYGNDFWNDTADLTWNEQMLYLRLLWAAWTSDGCRLPHDEIKLRRRSGCQPNKWKRLWATVKPFWRLSRDEAGVEWLTNDRLDVEFAKAERHAEISRANGAKGGRPSKRSSLWKEYPSWKDSFGGPKIQ